MEIVTTRIFADAREVVFNAFADPEQLARWWGPEGFRNTFKEFDLRAGGAWRFVMHAPNGAEYDNASEFVEVVKPARIVFQHLRPVHRFLMIMTFDDVEGGTRLTWRMQLEPDARNEVLNPILADANEQNFDRLGAHLDAIRG